MKCFQFFFFKFFLVEEMKEAVIISVKNCDKEWFYIGKRHGNFLFELKVEIRTKLTK